MKLIFAALSLLAVAFALRGDRTRYRAELVDPRNVESFRPGQSYRFQLDTQISSGMASVSEQHAVTRLQAEVLLQFHSERQVTLRLNEITAGSLNKEIAQPEKVQPIEMFKKHEIKPEDSKTLELACTFDYAHGLVENIRFNAEDQAWSKNIKKSVLNMLQLNLKQRTGGKVQLEKLPEWTKDFQSEYEKNDAEPKLFVLPEITLEGECQTTYTINKMSPRNKFNSYYDQELSREDNLKMFNVTKSIDFKQCNKIADIRYGPKVEKPCNNCTSPEELEEQKLERSTIIHHVVVGTPEKYGIQKVELVSHYLFKLMNVEEEKPMHTIVAGELTYVEKETSRRDEDREELRPVTSAAGKEETLLYNFEWDEQEKLFFMYGDEEFPQQQSSPFKSIGQKVEKAEKLMNKLITLWSDKTKGIETEATMTYHKLVELLRMCKEEELKQIFKIFKQGQSGSQSRLSDSDQLKAEELIVDAMSNAGTHNTIKVLVEMILRREITTYRAVRVLSQLKDLPAPSDKQVDTLTKLCQNEVCSRFQSCKQACWLTAGAIMGELCNEELTVEDAVEQKKGPLCQSDMKKKFIKNIMAQTSKVETRYEKILFLKALGNAGLDLSIFELEKIIRDIREEPLVRMQAIDSLRRLRAVMPEKIQRVLMPVFQDVKERPEIRMACVAQILATIPEKHILDSISYTLIRDPSRQVKSYVYTAMKTLSESPVKMEKELAQHLKALLKMAGITEEDEEEILRGSRYHRFPIYSRAKKEGIFVDFESMIGPDNVLPKHLHAGIDSFVNNVFKKTDVEVSFTQDDLEKWYDNIMAAFMDYYYGSTSSKKSSLRGYRSNTKSRDSSEENDEVRTMFSSLSIKRRTNRVDNDNGTPYGMLCFRLGDVDYAILPFEEEMLLEPLKKIVSAGERPSVRDFEKLMEYFQGRPFRLHGAINLVENSVKIPTSIGLPIRMLHVLPILASVEGHFKPEIRGSEIKVDMKLHPSLTATHLKRVEIWLPFLSTGVESARTVALNLPLNGDLTVKMQSTPAKFEWKFQVPEHKHRLVSAHTLPMTFVNELDNWVQIRMPAVKSIENQELINRARHIETTVGAQQLNLPLRVSGEMHWPQQMSYEEIVQVAFTSENHLNVDFHPEEETPREIVLVGEAQLFEDQAEDRAQHRELKSFYKKSKFDDEMDQYYESNTNDENDEQQLNKYLDDYQPRKMYKHFARFHLKTVGGRKEKFAKMEIQGSCDEKIRFCKANINVERSPLFDESREWTLKSQAQVLMPEYIYDINEYKEDRRSRRDNNNDKQHKFVSSMEVIWGSVSKQTINMNINGEQVRNKEWSEKISKIEKHTGPDAPKLREQMLRKVAFLNKYDISVQFNHLETSTVNFANWASTMLKNWNWWNTQVTLKENRGETKQITATFVIDPITHEHANLTVKTPMEIIRITPMSLPMKFKPFQLVEPSQQAIESFTDIISNYATESRPECKVDSRKVNTFDDVSFKAPLTKCYTVLAKDCSSEKRPRFAVMMKKLSGQDKKIKMTINSDIIEVEPESSDKLIVKINGQREQNYDTLRDFGIDYTEQMVRISNKDITVRFDGEQAWIKLSPFYKNRQCGICGHYDDNTEDEYRMTDNEFASDIKSFHKSYSLQDQECREDFEETHRREEYEPISDSRENYERDSEYEQRRRRTNENDETEPIERTEVMEHSHKICFSIKPVKACPEGSSPKQTKEHKTSFTCFDRTSSEARRLLRQARRDNEPIEVPTDKASFVQQLRVPTTCVVY